MPDKLRVLCVGDVVGSPGRQLLIKHLTRIQTDCAADMTIVNVENSAGGFGLTPAIYHELQALPIDVMTSGNHIFDKKELVSTMSQMPKLIRPLNFSSGVPGVGVREVVIHDVSVTVVNLIGRVFMGLSDCPFQKITAFLDQLPNEKRIVIIDIHAETTSEKSAMGWHVDGRVSLVFGTHTHVMTADERVLPGGTGFISDIGMTGPRDGVIGMEKEDVLKRFYTQIPHRLNVPKHGASQLNAICATIDCQTGHTLEIARIQDYF